MGSSHDSLACFPYFITQRLFLPTPNILGAASCAASSWMHRTSLCTGILRTNLANILQFDTKLTKTPICNSRGNQQKRNKLCSSHLLSLFLFRFLLQHSGSSTSRAGKRHQHPTLSQRIKQTLPLVSLIFTLSEYTTGTTKSKVH